MKSIRVYVPLLISAALTVGVLPLASNRGPSKPVLVRLSSELIPAAWAASDSFYNTMQDDLFMLIGYPDTATYNALTGGSGPPMEGLLGVANELATGVTQAVIANGTSGCSALPSSGDITGSATIFGGQSKITLDISYATPTHTIPDGYTGAGSTFQKRVNISTSLPVFGASKAGIEFNCGNNSAWLELQVPGDTIAGSTRTINMYIDTANNQQKAELMMTVTENSGTTLDDAQILRLAINQADATFQIWDAGFNYRSSNYSGYRMGMNGNASTGKVSTYVDYKYFGSSFSSISDGTDDYTSDSPSGNTFYSTSKDGSNHTLQGCADFTNTSQDPSGGTALCTGLPLTTPTAPIVDSGGAFSFYWLAHTLGSRVSMGF